MKRHIFPDVVNNQEICSLPKTATVTEAARLMNDRGISSILVMENERLEGIFTVRDVAKRVVAEGLSLDTPIGDVMTPDPETIDAQEIAQRGLHLMHDGGFRHLPVMKDGKVVGVVSRRNFISEEEKLLEREIYLWEHMA